MFNFWLPSLMSYLLENSFIPTFFSKIHVGIMWLKFFNKFYSISWEISNQYSTININDGMQNILNGLFYKLFYILPSYFWIISEYFTSFFIMGKYHLQWLCKCKKINQALERILIQFELDDFYLYPVVSNFSVNLGHNFIGSFFGWLFFLSRLCL